MTLCGPYFGLCFVHLCSVAREKRLAAPSRTTPHKRKAAPQGRRPGADLNKNDMQTIAELAREYPGVSITIAAADLLAFGEKLVADTMAAARQDEAARVKAASAEEFISEADACRLLGVSSQTLWRWRKRGYIESVSVGGRIKYRKEECQRILSGEGA